MQYGGKWMLLHELKNFIRCNPLFAKGDITGISTTPTLLSPKPWGLISPNPYDAPSRDEPASACECLTVQTLRLLLFRSIT